MLFVVYAVPFRWSPTLNPNTIITFPDASSPTASSNGAPLLPRPGTPSIISLWRRIETWSSGKKLNDWKASWRRKEPSIGVEGRGAAPARLFSSPSHHYVQLIQLVFLMQLPAMKRREKKDEHENGTNRGMIRTLNWWKSCYVSFTWRC